MGALGRVPCRRPTAFGELAISNVKLAIQVSPAATIPVVIARSARSPAMPALKTTHARSSAARIQTAEIPDQVRNDGMSLAPQKDLHSGAPPEGAMADYERYSYSACVPS